MAIFAVAARCHLRIKFMSRLVIEDWLMVLALALQITYQVGFNLMCDWGSGRPSNTLTSEQNYNINKWSWIFAPPGFLVSIIARVSIAILLVRIFGTKRWFKLYMTCFTTVQTAVGVASVIFLLAQCKPYEGLWNKAVIQYYWDKRIYQYTALALQYITYVLFPIIIIWKLKMRTRRKVGLLVVMALSLVTMAAAVAKITVSLIPMTGSPLLVAPAVQYYTSIINFTSDCEQCLVIIMGCIPTLHLATRLQLPTVSKFRDSLLGLVSGHRSKTSVQEKHMQTGSRFTYGSAHKNRDDYHELQLTPRVRVSDEESYGSTREALGGHSRSYISSQIPRVHASRNFGENEIYRTDSSTVSHKPQRAHEEV
ncbi:hypothetical protein TruAng_002205 [Truncatella angustata]|nr:hypothetical protein TruAng_002205 [Truncatella angustata]